MAATDKHYRSQKALDIVFAVSCVLMLASTFWMIVQDYNRAWKKAQREFRDVETALNERLMLDRLPDTTTVDAKRQAAQSARESLKAARASMARQEAELTAARQKADTHYRLVKAEYDSKMSYYDITVEELGKAPAGSLERTKLEQVRQDKRKELDRIQKQLVAAKDDIDKIDKQIRDEVRVQLDGPERALADAEDDLKRMTGAFDRFAKATAQKKWKFGDTIRAWPILDGFASPEKINQITLNDLTIDYGGFRDVPRYDRCTTCHQGMDRGIFDKTALAALATTPEELQSKLDTARKILEDRQKSGESLGFDLGDLPTKPVTVKLTPGEIVQFAAHPRLDLFVDANSPHPVERFGCTPCHAGQGSATDFMYASHTPTDALQEHQWRQRYGWSANHDWEFPMFASRFAESACLKCHHQVTDLIRQGSKEEAPKLLRGYNLVRENGCFGCHEISGWKAGRAIGPDLRLEPAPALDFLSAMEQDKARSDPLNPPGSMRRVGPGLRRIAEKTDETWTRKWIQSPRGFREDTKMPHFYGLSTNGDSVLPPEQQGFPDAEIHSIAHYLFTESRGTLKGEDTYRLILISQLKALHEQLSKGSLSDKDKKEMVDATRGVADLALLCAPPDRQMRIHAANRDLRQAQDRVLELYRAPTPEPDAIAREVGELPGMTDKLIALGKPVTLATEVVDGANAAIDAAALAKAIAPPAEKDKAARQAKGKQLFTEKGCLACHANEAAPVESEANFGPNLSRLAAKIKPASGADAGRRWLVQWILNPNVHYARTRMPITHLGVAEAGDVAEFLLSPEIKRSEEIDAADSPGPTVTTLKELARVYLLKAPGMTRAEVAVYLPLGGDDLGGIPPERVQLMSRDADERALEGPNLGLDKLKWYIGKKSIGRLGCYACHDLPGFESAKPIGVALNDWGKKDGARLAFEDADAYVKETYHFVTQRKTAAEIAATIAELEEKAKKGPLSNDEKHELDALKGQEPWQVKDGKRPFEEVFFEALEHHQREGFLHLKLMDPRSYDYNRLRTWDDRLRMPQFQFARTHQHKGESNEDYQVRKEKEEAEAREAVMAFVLGLVAEQVPLKHVHTPNVDKLAENKGRQVLDKYNCAGCHPVRSGIYEFRQTKEQIGLLAKAYENAAGTFPSDHPFAGHNAWFGTPETSAEKLTAIAVSPQFDEDVFDRKVLTVRLTDALRFVAPDGMLRDIPAASIVPLVPETIIRSAEPYGGTFVELLIGKPGEKGYLGAAYEQRFSGKPDEARSALPPPLIREGERVQPKWLYQFLLNPGVIRPQNHMLLRMPRFNLSPDESMALANYFASASKTGNPGAGVTYPYLAVEQQDARFWQMKDLEYRQSAPTWVKTLEGRLAAADKALKAAKDDDKEAAQKTFDDLSAAVKKAKVTADAVAKQGTDRYAIDGYKLLLNKESCVKCHSVGAVLAESASGPNLILSAERLRPEWTVEWLANPKRLISYQTLMPQNFSKNTIEWQDSFAGPPLEQARAARDVLMDLPRIAELPEVRKLQPAAAAGGGK